MDLSLPEAWLLAGATFEFDLPRNLACAACSGGGCDACERSGAVSVRGRKDPTETVELTLPKLSPEDTGPRSNGRVVLMRIPDRGGSAPAGSDLPRGNLLLSVLAGPEPTAGARRLAAPSLPPPALPPEVLLGAPPLAAAAARRRALALWAIAAAALAALAAWWFR